MSQKTCIPFIACLLALICQLPSFALKGWKLHQTSDFYGDQVTYVSPEMIVIETKKMGIKLFMTAPDFNITGVNYGSKSYARLSSSECKSELLGNARSQHFAHKKFGRDVVAGMNTIKYGVENSERPTVKTLVPASTIDGKTYNTLFWAATDIKIPVQFTDMMSSMMQVPHGLGVPMRMMQYTGKGTEIVSLDTKKAELVTIPADLTVIPKGYVKVKDEMSLLFSDSPDDDLDNILRHAQKGVRKPSTPWVPGADAGNIGEIPGGPLHSKQGQLHSDMKSQPHH